MDCEKIGEVSSFLAPESRHLRYDVGDAEEMIKTPEGPGPLDPDAPGEHPSPGNFYFWSLLHR